MEKNMTKIVVGGVTAGVAVIVAGVSLLASKKRKAKNRGVREVYSNDEYEGNDFDTEGEVE